MSIEQSVSIDVELVSVGQRDQTERWPGKLEVTREEDGRVRIGKPTQSGFEALILDVGDLLGAVSRVDALAADQSRETSE